MEITAPGFVVTQNITQPDGRRYLFAEKDKTGLVLSATLERVKGQATLKGCQDGLRGRTGPNAPFKMAAIKYSQLRDMAVMEYMVLETKGVPIKQKSIFGCLAVKNAYIDIHISKTLFDPADQELLMKVLDSAAIVTTESTDGTNSMPSGSAAFYAEGGKYFILHDYEKAIGPYQEALNLEKKERKLDDKN